MFVLINISIDRTALAPPALARNSDVGPSTTLDHEKSNVKQSTTDRSEIPTPVIARSGLVPPSSVRIHETNKNLVETQKRTKGNIAANDTISFTKETGILTFTKESDRSSTEAGGFAARRTFNGSGSDVWLEFIRYFENVMAMNNWSLEKARRIFYVCSEVRDFGKAVESLFLEGPIQKIWMSSGRMFLKHFLKTVAKPQI